MTEYGDVSAANLKQAIENTEELPFPVAIEDDSVTITATATNLPANVKFKENNQLTEKQRSKPEKCTAVMREYFQVKQVAQGREAVKHIKQDQIPGIANHISKRMQIFSASNIADHSRWDYSNKDYGIAEIKVISSHFEESLKSHRFSIDLALSEWKGLKKVVKDKYQHFTNKAALWKQIFIHHQIHFPHILVLIELVLVTPYSSAPVERGFSLMKRLLSNTSLNLSNKTLDDLMMLRIHFPALVSCDPRYEHKLVEKALSIYLGNKNRKTTASKPAMSSVSALSSADTFLPVSVGSLLKAVGTANELTFEDFITHQRDTTESDYDTDYEQTSSSDTDFEMDTSLSIKLNV